MAVKTFECRLCKRKYIYTSQLEHCASCGEMLDQLRTFSDLSIDAAAAVMQVVSERISKWRKDHGNRIEGNRT